MEYNSYKFIYPPRPEQKITDAQLIFYESLGEFLAQPKYNGDCCNVFLIPGEEIKIINRHNEPKKKIDPMTDFDGLMSDRPMVLSGELMSKSKLGEDGLTLKGFIIWDILVHDGEYLIGSTVEERMELLEKLWPTNRMMVSEKGIFHYEHLSFTPNIGIYKSPTYLTGFDTLYHELVKTDAYEGLVLKKKAARLTYGFNEKNNSSWQIKCRKPTKNYKF